MARLVGGLPKEVVMMNSLSCNLHMMMAAFYCPTATRFKILIEKKAFPSDTHAVVSQIQLHNLDPATALIEIAPREGETTLRMEDILHVIATEGASIALIMFSGVQYYTGQLFDMSAITAAGHAQGCKVGFDLAHAVGNVPLKLHDWGCDFACWCTYKYMNCGPGSIGGCFVHERHGNAGSHPEILAQTADGPYIAPDPVRMAGWWGHRRDDRFVMAPHFIPAEGVNGFRLSNPPVLLMACVRASLDLFDKVGAS
jgi:kynureninase